MKWISIKDKLPDLFRKVIVWIDPPKALLGYSDHGLYEGKGKWYVVTNKHTVQHITHWMEPDTPQPYVPYSDSSIAFGMVLKSKLKEMEIKFKSIESLALFVMLFMDSEEAADFDIDAMEQTKIALDLEKFINIHGHE